jgi:NTE family protein
MRSRPRPSAESSRGRRLRGVVTGLVLVGVLALAAGCARLPAKDDIANPPATVPIVPLREGKPIVGLALGAGGLRGFAHIGVIKALEAAGIDARIVTGTSAGALVGAAYAAGLTAHEIEALQSEVGNYRFRDFTWDERGFVTARAVEELVNRVVQQRPIEQLERRLAVVATEVVSGKPAIFNWGDVGRAVRASTAIPGAVVPVAINGKDYMDGDAVSPVPAHLARQMGADLVIAVDISRYPEEFPPDSRSEMLWQTIAIMRQRLLRDELAAADVVIRPDLLFVDGSTTPEMRARTIAAGEQAALAKMREIKEKLHRTALAKFGGDERAQNCTAPSGQAAGC